MRALILAAALLVPLAQNATAEPAHARAYQSQYGYAPACNACHQDGGGSPLNAYGQAFADAGENAGAFAAIADQDADGDGHANAVEAQARANPGAASSTPDKPGNWLALENMIPQEVRAAFPEARQFKPIDTILTDTEIARAARWGVSLTDADENTIYVPVIDGRAAGTALIVRGSHAEEDFYLLVSTDRQLAVAQVEPVAGQMLQSLSADAYTGFRGWTAEEAPGSTASSEPQQAAMAAAVRRALALITVRLKKDA